MSGEFVAEPVVPIELTMTSGRCFTLYRPGWHTSEGSAPFPGETGKVLVFSSLSNLQAYVDSEGIFPEARPWTEQDYESRLCKYDLSSVPEANTGSSDDQLELGSVLAVLLDLLDQLDVKGEHADALREDEKVERLASGEALSEAAEGAQLRETLAAHWSRSVEKVAAGVVLPDVSGRRSQSGRGPAGRGAGRGATATGAGAAADAAGEATSGAASEGGMGSADLETGVLGAGSGSVGIMLEEVAGALTLWFGLTERGVYTLRSTEVHDGHPTYPDAGVASAIDGAADSAAGGESGSQSGSESGGESGSATGSATNGSASSQEADGGERQLAAWESLDQLAQDLTARRLSFDEPTMAGLEGLEVDLTPDDEDIFDLVQIGKSIHRRMTVEESDAVVTAWTELVRLAGWGGWQDVLHATVPPSTLGRFVVTCAVDRAQDRMGADQAIGSADLETVKAEWTALVEMVERHTRIYESSDSETDADAGS